MQGFLSFTKVHPLILLPGSASSITKYIPYSIIFSYNINESNPFNNILLLILNILII